LVEAANESVPWFVFYSVRPLAPPVGQEGGVIRKKQTAVTESLLPILFDAAKARIDQPFRSIAFGIEVDSTATIDDGIERRDRLQMPSSVLTRTIEEEEEEEAASKIISENDSARRPGATTNDGPRSFIQMPACKKSGALDLVLLVCFSTNQPLHLLECPILP
jgi:hypothetical protein